MPFNAIYTLLVRPDIQKRALMIAVIVGTLLNCINQVPEMLNGESLQLIKAGLTYCVPYCVSLFSSVASLLR